MSSSLTWDNNKIPSLLEIIRNIQKSSPFILPENLPLITMRGFLFSYEKIFEVTALSETDMKNQKNSKKSTTPCAYFTWRIAEPKRISQRFVQQAVRK